ncbi:MAG TPA: YSC84-related protein [Terriglobales bacterium]|nr:YSC84-related protein [Terriglobales bacterium]
MKKFMFLLAMVSLGTLCWAGSAREDATDRLDNATKVLHEIMGMPDNGIPEEVLEHAKCVAVVPHMVKAGFIFGGKGGKGVATCRTASGWSAPAFITISGGSWGLQIGVEAVDLVMIIQNEKGMQKLLSSNFQIGADASAAAGPVGRHASAGTDWKLDTEILTYSRAKGAFAGLTLEGASIRQDSDSRHAMYGRKVTTQALLLGKVPAPSAARPFLAEIRGAKAQAVAEGKAEAGKAEAKSEAKENVTITGCLQKGDDPDKFSMIARDGKTWELHSTRLKLDEHLGHTVTVTGPRTYESKTQEKAEEKREGVVKASNKEEYGDLGVTSLKMVSQTCSK